MRKIRGFKIGKRLVKLCRSVFRTRNSPSTYRRLISPAYKTPISNTTKTSLSNWYNWTCLKTQAKRFCSIKPGPGSGLGYVPLGHDPMLGKPVPKGHLAVYVGQKSDAGAGDGDFSRVLVPVMYFNHPLFGELLREAEEEFGYHHQGGITIPCRISEFEKVQTTIAAGRSCRRLLTWRRNY